MLDWVLDAGLSCTKGVWYIYDWDTGSLSDVVLHVVHSSCNLLDNIKGLESTFFLFRPLTKLPHPNTIYRCIRWPGVGSWVLASELC